MKVEDRKVYKCEFCNKFYLIKHWCLQHENRCSKNPENDRACFGCIHLERVETSIYKDGPIGGELEIPVQALYCNKLKKHLIPPRAEHKGNAYDFGDILNDPMPNVCDSKTTH